MDGGDKVGTYGTAEAHALFLGWQVEAFQQSRPKSHTHTHTSYTAIVMENSLQKRVCSMSQLENQLVNDSLLKLHSFLKDCLV